MPETERLSQTETRAYDPFQRMTSMTTFGGGTIAYNYSQTANDGKIVSQTSGAETINYNYDSLGRLTQATTAGTDGWGNRLTQNAVKGAVPTMVTITDPATNRIQSHTYDQNGNTTNTPQQGAMTYDVMNRLKTVASDTYGYDPSNKRVWKNDELTFWGAGGERIGRYSATKLVDDTGTHVFVFQKVQVDEYFGGRRLTTQDRLGSVGSYYPYGEAKSGTVSNADSFATYYRDSTGLDYADQRHYAAGIGRFTTADPYQASAGRHDPASWNRFSYVQSDPFNFIDRSGQMMAAPGTKEGGGEGWAPSPITSPISGPSDPGSSDPDPGGGGGGGGSNQSAGVVSVGNVTKAGAQYDAVQMAFARTLAFLDADCEKFLNSGGLNVRDYVSDLFAYDLVAVGSAPSAIAAFTNIGGTDVPEGYAAMVFNSNSAFFNGGLSQVFKVNNGKITGGTAKAQTFIILHELAHALSASGFKNDLNNPQAGKENDNAIDKNCGKTFGNMK